MRPSSRFLIPALTIICWTVDSAYASVRPSAQSLYKRGVHAPDYATSSRPTTYDPSTTNSGTPKSPESESPSSVSRTASDTSEKPKSPSDNHRRSLSRKSQVPPADYRKAKRDDEDSNEPTSLKFYDDSNPIKSSHSNVSARDLVRRRAFFSSGNTMKRADSQPRFGNTPTPMPAQRKSTPAETVVARSPSEETKQPGLHARSVDLSTLHIARGLRGRALEAASPLTNALGKSPLKGAGLPAAQASPPGVGSTPDTQTPNSISTTVGLPNGDTAKSSSSDPSHNVHVGS
ncbi:hypothetical protein H0H93_000528 [Arthromyces matolae]|nr:hypothetical protein H0H93_000528 [Arthromyces matolae]